MSVVHRLEEPSPTRAGLRFLIYRAGRHVFTTLDDSESRPATGVHVDGLIVACAGDTALPFWRVPTDRLPADLPADSPVGGEESLGAEPGSPAAGGAIRHPDEDGVPEAPGEPAADHCRAGAAR